MITHDLTVAGLVDFVINEILCFSNVCLPSVYVFCPFSSSLKL